MIAKKFIKSTVISARPNWLRSIDKRGNTIQSLSASNRDLIIQSTVPLACRKRRLNLAVSRNNRIKAALKNPRNVYGVGSPAVGTTSSVRLHICAVTYITEISLHVTLNTNRHSEHYCEYRFCLNL